MLFYLAPMEGITGYIVRNAYAHYFPYIDKYFTPFIIPNKSRRLKTKELRDILPENNKGITIIPQILLFLYIVYFPYLIWELVLYQLYYP